MDFQSFWQRRALPNMLLLPAAGLFAAAAALRRALHPPPAAAAALPPIVVVGNIVVGGAGKTPVVIALARALAQRGWRPGIISRGVGGNVRDAVREVTAESKWQECGDEALLLHRRTQLPVCISRRRLRAAQRLARAGCTVIISDDGLQHLALPRTVEICVTDADYRFGNGWRLPAGPLRDAPARAAQCTFQLLVGAAADEGRMTGVQRKADGIYPLSAPQQRCEAAFFHGKRVTALAGIARPQSFFTAMESFGIQLEQKIPLADHAVTALDGIDSEIILMTEKDAVKYPASDKRLYAAAIRCDLPEEFVAAVEGEMSGGAVGG